MLHVYKASAGSGKTYTLTFFYLKICFQHPDDPTYFRHILTMTFTNAATAEMKGRILKELQFLAFEPKQSEHLHNLSEECQMEEEQVSKVAAAILQKMMEYYSSFAVTTIDSFFQSVLRLFTRELDLKAGYEVELDTSRVLARAMDDFLAEVEPESEGMYWVEAVLQKRWEEEKSNDIRDELTALGQELFQEGIYERMARVDASRLKDLRHRIITSREQIILDFQGVQEEAMEILKELDLEPTDFKGKNRGFVRTWLVTYLDFKKVVEDGSEKLAKGVDAVEEWITKSEEGSRRALLEQAYERLNPLLKKTVDWIDQRIPEYKTLDAIHKNFAAFGFLTILDHYVQRYCDREQRILISETTELLKKVIDHQILPFFYERMGERYHHILLDEFQDTSGAQWENLKILVENAVSEYGGSSLIVGDVKQAIYRWRNGDWSILQFRLHDHFAPENKYREASLKSNWRSDEQIVEFNNELYAQLPGFLRDRIHQDHQMREDDGLLMPEIIPKVYEDAAQSIHEGILDQRRGGYVHMDFFISYKKDVAKAFDLTEKVEKEDQKEAMFDRMRATIVDALKRGFDRREICILVRKKSQSTEVAGKLLAWQGEEDGERFLFTSPEVMRLDQSYSVQAIMAFFQLCADAKDPVAHLEWAQALAGVEHQPLSFSLSESQYAHLSDLLQRAHGQSLWEISEMVIAHLDLGKNSGEIPFLQELQDQILAFTGREGGHIREWLEYWEDSEIYAESVSLPEEQDAIRVMTIHKSKGQEYPIVILPYLDWGIHELLDRSPASIVWADAFDLHESHFPTFPVEFNKHLEDSHFRREFQYELIAQTLDRLNLLYVATTRPRAELYLFALHVNFEGCKTAGDSLFNLPWVKAQLSARPDDLDTCRFSHSFGRKKAVQQDTSVEATTVLKLDHYHAGTEIPSLSARLKQSTLEEEEMSPLSRGSLLHGIMEQVFSPGDLERKLLMAQESGEISSTDAEAFREDVHRLLEHPKIGPLLQKKSNFLAERDVLLPGGTTLRPDRVVIEEEVARVIDFKTGEKYSAHRRQIVEYMEALASMGYAHVKGYLVYLDLEKLVEIEQTERTS